MILLVSALIRSPLNNFWYWLFFQVSCHKAALLQLEQQAIDPEKDRTDYDTLVDNSDHSVKIAWHCVYRLVIVDV